MHSIRYIHHIKPLRFRNTSVHTLHSSTHHRTNFRCTTHQYNNNSYKYHHTIRSLHQSCYTLTTTKSTQALNVPTPAHRTRLPPSTSQYGRYTVYSVVLLCSTWFIFPYIGGISYGSGWSMYPTMNPAGVYFIYERITPYITKSLQCGDIVMCNVIHMNNESRGVVKRVIGLPGDIIRRDPTDSTSLYELQCNECWLQGDLLGGSNDSRSYGPVQLNNVHGRVVAVIYPYNDMKWMERTLKYRGY